MKRILDEMQVIPPGYGIAYPLWNECRFVCYPVPINLLVRWARQFWFACIQQGRDRHMEIFNRGMEKGREIKEAWLRIKLQDEYNRGKSDVLNELLQKLERERTA